MTTLNAGRKDALQFNNDGDLDPNEDEGYDRPPHIVALREALAQVERQEGIMNGMIGAVEEILMVQGTRMCDTGFVTDRDALLDLARFLLIHQVTDGGWGDVDTVIEVNLAIDVTSGKVVTLVEATYLDSDVLESDESTLYDLLATGYPSSVAVFISPSLISSFEGQETLMETLVALRKQGARFFVGSESPFVQMARQTPETDFTAGLPRLCATISLG